MPASVTQKAGLDHRWEPSGYVGFNNETRPVWATTYEDQSGGVRVRDKRPAAGCFRTAAGSKLPRTFANPKAAHYRHYYEPWTGENSDIGAGGHTLPTAAP